MSERRWLGVGARRCGWALGVLGLVGVLAGCNSTTAVAPSSGGDGVPGAGVGGACVSDLDCRQGLSCQEDTCQPSGAAGAGEPCGLTGECGEGLYCEPLEGGVCLPGGDALENIACAGSQDCAPGLVCQLRGFTGGVCAEPGEADVGQACAVTLDCLAGLTCKADAATGESACQPGALGLPEPFVGVQCAEDSGPMRGLFEVPEAGAVPSEFYRMPFPHDARLVNNHPNMAGHATPGKGLLDVDIVQAYLDKITAEQDRFGTNQGVFMRFSGRLNFDSVISNGDARNVLLVDISPESAEYSQRRALYWQASTASNRYICDNWMMIRPAWGRPLRPRTTYAALVLNTVRGEDGGAVAQDADFAATLSDQAPSDARLRGVWEAHAPLRAWLQDEGIAASSVVVGSVFTTGDPWAVTRQLRQAARDAGVPSASEWTLCDAGVTSPCDDGLEGEAHLRGCFGAPSAVHEVHVKVELPIVQEGTLPYADEGGGVVLSGGRPQVQGREAVCAALTVPKGATMPAEGWPVLIVAHGTGGSFRGHVGGVGAQVTTLNVDGQPTPMVTVGWDQVQHFTRRGDSELDPEGLVYNFRNPDAARGNVWQGVVDVHALVAWLEGLDLGAGASPTGEALKINPEAIYFLGHSQGSTNGSLALPFEPAIKAAVLSGAGGGLALSLLTKTSPVNIPQAVALVLQESGVGEAHPVINLVQGFFDPVDPLNYGEYIGSRAIEGETTPTHVMHTIGLGDTFTSEDVLETMATSMRAILARPKREDFQRGSVLETDAPVSGNAFVDGVPYTVVTRQYQPEGYDGHFVLFQNPEAQDDLLEFLGTGLVRGLPELTD